MEIWDLFLLNTAESAWMGVQVIVDVLPLCTRNDCVGIFDFLYAAVNFLAKSHKSCTCFPHCVRSFALVF